MEVQWDLWVLFGVVLVVGGYLESYVKGDIIFGLLESDQDICKVFYVGIQLDGE